METRTCWPLNATAATLTATISLPCICGTPHRITGHLHCPAHGVRIPPPVVRYSTTANPA